MTLSILTVQQMCNHSNSPPESSTHKFRHQWSLYHAVNYYTKINKWILCQLHNKTRYWVYCCVTLDVARIIGIEKYPRNWGTYSVGGQTGRCWSSLWDMHVPTLCTALTCLSYAGGFHTEWLTSWHQPIYLLYKKETLIFQKWRSQQVIFLCLFISNEFFRSQTYVSIVVMMSSWFNW